VPALAALLRVRWKEYQVAKLLRSLEPSGRTKDGTTTQPVQFHPAATAFTVQLLASRILPRV